MRPERSLPRLAAPGPIRIRAWFRSAGSLLRELSRALNRGRSTIRAESGLPVGTRLALMLGTEALSEPIEVSGTVTGWRHRGGRHEMSLRYDFDPAPQRARLAQAMAELKRGTLRPRRELRVPLALRVEAEGLEAATSNVSRAGCRLELSGPRLPALAPGSRLELALSGDAPGARRAVRLTLEMRWTEAAPGPGRLRRLRVGGRFLALDLATRRRLRAILGFDDLRPRIRIVRVTGGPGAERRARKAR
jgi:hypothetical protein